MQRPARLTPLSTAAPSSSGGRTRPPSSSPALCRSGSASPSRGGVGALPLIGLHVRRRSSDSTTSLASSASEGGGGGVADLLLEPPGTESDEGPPSANSAAECDRLPSGAAARPERRLASPCR